MKVHWEPVWAKSKRVDMKYEVKLHILHKNQKYYDDFISEPSMYKLSFLSHCRVKQGGAASKDMVVVW